MMKHPFVSFSFCPRCGERRFLPSGGRSCRCEACGLQLYANVAGAVAAFIFDEQGRLLIARRAKEPEKGRLDLPGGFAEPGETAEEALQREVLEETGLVIGQPDYLFSLPNVYPFGGLEVHTLDLFFRVQLAGSSQLRAMDDVCELHFIPTEQVVAEDFGLPSIREAVQRYVCPQKKGGHIGAKRR